MTDTFRRHHNNPILSPSERWWEGKGVLNPGITYRDGKLLILYRAVGNDGISRLGLAMSTDGMAWHRLDHPVFESVPADLDARLGFEDPRLTTLEGTCYLTFTKTAVGPGTEPRLEWETAPFRLRSWLAQARDFRDIRQVAPILAERNTKDSVLFPKRIGGRYAALVREYPCVHITFSTDLKHWSPPVTVLEPKPGTWEGERVGAGPPPIRLPQGWLVLYHANEYLEFPGNKRLYRMGLALLDGDDPTHVLYRHPEPIFEPRAPYECEGPVGNVVFGTGLIEDGLELHLYYGAGDGVIGVASADRRSLLGLIPSPMSRAP